jgi:hypothetical protein
LLILLISETLLGRWHAAMTEGHFDALARVSTGPLRDIRIAFVHCLAAGYLPAALLQVLRGGKRTVLALQNALDCSPSECRKLTKSIRLSPAWLLIIGSAGLIMALLTPYLVPPIPEAPWNPANWSPEVTWHRILGPFTMVWAFWLGYSIVSVSLRMSRIANELNRINLFDLAPLSPFTQQGLTNALLVVGSVSIFSLMSIEKGFGLLLLVLCGVTLSITILSLFAPVWGVHKRILQEKQKETAWLDREILKLRDTLPDPAAVRQSGEMADLICYRGLVGNVPEWPFTSSTYRRLVLYILLPVMTWALSIFAEQIIGHLFQ